MPRTASIDTARNAILVTVTGVFTEQEFRMGTSLAVQDPRFRPDCRVLVDFSGVTQFAISASALVGFVRAKHFVLESRRAFVVASGFGASFVEFGKQAGAVEQIRVFQDRASALAWLNDGYAPDQWLG